MSLDQRFRDAAAAEGLLDVAYDLRRLADRPAARRRHRARPLPDLASTPIRSRRRLERARGPLGTRVLRSPGPLEQRGASSTTTSRARGTTFDLRVDLAGLPRLPAGSPARAARVPYGGNDHVRWPCDARRAAAGSSSRRRRAEPQPGTDRAPLPPHRRRDGKPCRLRRRPRPEARPPRPRRGRSLPAPGPPS